MEVDEYDILLLADCIVEITDAHPAPYNKWLNSLNKADRARWYKLLGEVLFHYKEQEKRKHGSSTEASSKTQ
jgi:hypothetical protein